MKKYILILFVFVFGFMIINITKAQQATPSASVVWSNPKNPGVSISSVNQGEDATETWTVIGADPGSVIGHCYNSDNSFNSTHPISVGPQSYTFASVLIEKSMTCEVHGTAADGHIFSSGLQTVTVNPPVVTPPPVTPPPAAETGTPTCFFDQPGDQSTSYNLPNSNYVSYVPSDADARYGVIGWKSVSVKSGQAWVTSPALDSSYVATLSGGSFDGTKTRQLAESNVQLNRSELFQFNTYTLTIQKNGATVTSCSVKFSPAPVGALPVVGTPPPTYPVSGAAGKIVFVKKLIQGNIKEDVRPTDIMNLVAIKDKFIVDAECNSGLGLSRNNLWVASEDGSSVTPRNGCQDSALNVWVDNFDANVASRILPYWDGTGDSFIHEVDGAGENHGTFGTGVVYPIDPKTGFPDYTKGTGEGHSFNRAVLYHTSGTSASVTSVGPEGSGWSLSTVNGVMVPPNPDDAGANSGLIALKNKIITGTGQVRGLPDWNILGSIGSSGGRGNDYMVGFGDFLVDLSSQGGQVFTVGSNSKNPVQTLPDFKPSNGLYTFDNSTWPSKLALLSWAANPNWVNNGSGTDPTNFYIGTIKVYSLGTNGLVLDKTLTVKGQNSYTGFGVWGKYVAIPGTDSSSHPAIELWDGSTGTKLDAVSMTVDFGNGNGKVYTSLFHPSISKGGYMALSTSSGSDNSVYLYKLNVPAPGGNNNQGNNNQNNNQQPVIVTQSTQQTQSVSSPSFSQTRSYTWATTAPNNGDILWGVNWGDASVPTSTGTCQINPPRGTGRNWTFTTQHTWNAPGNYTIRVYASDCVNPTTVFSFLVNIGTGGQVQGVEAFHFSQKLQRGSSGNEVTELQNFLNKAGYDTGTVDGKFGLKTQTALIKFQIANELTGDGIVGPLVRAVLNK